MTDEETKYETRSVQSIEVRSVEEGKPPVIAGVAIVFGQRSLDLGGFYEVIAPGAVTLDPGLYLDFDHQSEYILGCRGNGTLSTHDDGGVAFEATPPDTTWARDLEESIRGGYIKGCSFTFEARDDQWERLADGTVLRTVTDALVRSLTITGIPAYPQTSAETRDRAHALLSDTPITLDPDGKPKAPGAEGTAENREQVPGTVLLPHFGLKTIRKED